MYSWTAIGHGLVHVLERLRDFGVRYAGEFQTIKSAGEHGFHAYCISGGDLENRLDARIEVAPVDVRWDELQLMRLRRGRSGGGENCSAPD
jgi:hypothetical protein